MFFEDFKPGMQLETPARTITQTDIVNFSCLTGDFNAVHTDWEYCKTTPFGEPIAHGMLVAGVAAGLLYASGMNDGTLMALLEVKSWKMLKPVKHGDTIRNVTTVKEKRPTSKPDRGIVRFLRETRNQRGETVQEMDVVIMYRSRGDVRADGDTHG
jgi:acyl dehydratase